MGRRERLLQLLIDHVNQTRNVDRSLDDLRSNSHYGLIYENVGSHILNIKRIGDMKLCLENAIGDDEAAKCLTALIFCDLYLSENTIAQNCECQRKSEPGASEKKSHQH